MNNSQQNEDEEKEIIQPSASARHRFMLEGDKAKLEHPRKELWRWLISYLKPFRWKFSIYFIFLLMGTVIISVSPLISASIIDNGIVPRNTHYVIVVSTIYLSLMLIMAITNYFSQYGMGKISQKITFEIRNELFFKLQNMSLTYFDQRSSGDIMSIMTNDVTILNQLVGGQFVQIITSFVSIVLTVIFMFLLNPFLALISMVIFPLFFLTTYFFKKVAIGLFKESRKTIGKVTTSIQENIAGAKVVQAYGQEKRASSEFDEANKANYMVMKKIRRYMATIFPLITLLTTILTAGILLAGGIVVVEDVSIFGIPVTVGVLSAYITILGQFFRPFMMLMQIQQVIEASLAASDRIYTLLGEKVEIPDFYSPKVLDNVTGIVKFDAVDFGYILENNIENNLNLKSPKPDLINQRSHIQNPMMKGIVETIKSFPEPYSTFLFRNIIYMPRDISQKLFMSLMGTSQSEIPEKIDKILAEFKYAVPNTEMAKIHPEYKISFQTKELGEQVEKGVVKQQSFSLEQIIPPDTVLMMVKFLERSLRSNTGLQQSSGMGSEGGGMIGSGMPQMSPQSILRMLASISIPPEIYQQIPKNVKNAIDEQKILIQHEQSKGYVLRDLTLKIPAGATIAIVGKTGSGKTTLIKLLARFYDVNNGKILIDDVNIREIRKKDLRDLIGIVPQDTFLFTGTIRENLLYAFDDPSPEIEKKMIEVSKFLGLHNFIETLHKRYDTKLKENASNISIGQRQLIAFARALITDPKILILDEASSSVDPYTETLIQDALNKARKGRTTIIIAHRLSTIKNADHIIVLSADKKGIIEQGDHETLLSLNGIYKRFLEMQHRDIEISG